MEELKTLLFEDPFYLYVSLVLAELVAIGMYYSRRTRRWLGIALVPAVLAGAVFITERLVVTDREQILAASEQIARDVAARNWDGVSDRLDDKLFGGHWAGRALAIAAAKAYAAEYSISEVRVGKGEIVVDERPSGNGLLWARMKTTTVIMMNGGKDRMPVTWTVSWVKRPDGWKIAEVDQPQVGLQ